MTLKKGTQKVNRTTERPITTALLIEKDLEDARLIREMFKDQGSYSFSLARVGCMADAETYLAGHLVDVVLLDLGSIDSFDLEKLLGARTARHASIVLLCGLKDEGIAMRALEGGVQDYLIKGQIESRELMRAMRNSVTRKKLEETLFSEKNRAQITLNCIGDAVICTDNSGNISFLNPVAERMTGWSLKEAAGRPLGEAFLIMDASTGEIATDPTAGASGEGGAGQMPVNCILTRRDGHQVFIEDSAAPIRDRDGIAAGTVLVFREVTVPKTVADQIAHRAEHDSLTGLPNRLLMHDRLNQAIARAYRRASVIAILFLDLDNFKDINDSLGHQIGDKLLISVAGRLQKCVRTADTVSRRGGDEFILLLPDVQDAEDAAKTARRILEAMKEPFSIDRHDCHVTVSIGISVYPHDGLDAPTLLKNADTAMYRAKESGRQNFRFFKPQMNVKAEERHSIKQDLRCALERQELTVQYQPIVDLKSGDISGVEALLRWTHPTRGPVEPALFIPVAEDSGLIVPIGAWVLREACMQAKAWEDAGLPEITMSVNVSALQFRSKGFLHNLTSTLDETGLKPESLNIEVTESGLMELAGSGAPILRALRDRGVQVTVDDFGTGYSSLHHLRKLPVNALKIDRSFVRQISTTPEDTTILSTIISMGRSLKLRVIAEGVESAEDLAFLDAENCDEAQGFFFSWPVSAEQLAELLKLQVN